VSTGVRLNYQPPYDFAALLAFFAKRAIPGVETVDTHSYRRTFTLDGKVGSLHVAAVPGANALALQVDFPDLQQHAQIEARVRRLFDLDADIVAINRHLTRHATLKPWIKRNAGQRLPGGWDGFEIAVRAVLGQQVTVAAARTLTERAVRKFGSEFEMPQNGKVYLFPTPQMLAEADLSGLGITGARIKCLHAVAQALCDGRIDFRADQPLNEFVERWVTLPGIGAWTAHYMAMRALSHADAFPAADIVLRKAVAKDGVLVSTKALEGMAEAWRPYRAYAVLHLWRSMAAIKA
jgi:AraC family transcriptional regulator, regulatory protein of adaptative response / DNA-3-methyladenine glycosylase II